MAEHKYDIFISYRRAGGYDTAKHLYDLLARDGYRVSFDIDTLRNGNFDVTLLNRVDQCKDFILIVDKNAFDRTLDSSFDPNNDWLRQELAYALKKDKNIIPIFLNGISGFPSGLPEDISGVTKKNGPEYNRYYFNDFYKSLKNRFLLSRSHKYNYWKIGFMLLCIFLISCVIIQIFTQNNNNKENDSTTFQETSVDSLIYDIQTTERTTDTRTSLMKFTGDFVYTVPNLGYGGINTVYELVLDPINSSATIVEDGIVNIENSLGYYGTMMRWPEYWEIINFSVNSNGNEAVVQMIGGDNNICEIKLELDEYRNIIMSFISGNEGPSVLEDENGNYTESVTFKRSN